MSDGMHMQMEGIEEMTKALAKVGSGVAKRGPAASVRAGGSVIIKEMRRRAPKDTGSLKKSIGQKVKTYRGNKTVTGIIGARSKAYATAKGKRNPAYYAHLVELGTAPHATGKKKSFYRRGSGKHPGSKAQPFMRPAWDAAAPAARIAVVDKMTTIFEQEARAAAVR